MNTPQSITTLLDVLNFAKKACENELASLNKSLQTYEEEKSKLIALHAPSLPKNLEENILATQKKIEKVKEDILSIDKVLVQANTKINASKAAATTRGYDADRTKRLIEREAIKVIKPFFTNYENIYDGNQVNMAMAHGESQFQKVMKKTSKYEKLEKKINTLNQKVVIYTAKKEARNKKYGAGREEMQNRITILRGRQCKNLEKQQVVMLRREAIIRKRNKKISKFEAKRDNALNVGEIDVANKFDEKITKLKGKKIRQMPANLILFTQYMSDFARRRHFDSKGNEDTRRWTERRIEALQGKAKKAL